MCDFSKKSHLILNAFGWGAPRSFAVSLPSFAWLTGRKMFFGIWVKFQFSPA